MAWDVSAFTSLMKDGFESGREKKAEYQKEYEKTVERMKKETEETTKQNMEGARLVLEEMERAKKDALDAEKLKQEQWKTKMAELDARNAAREAASVTPTPKAEPKKAKNDVWKWLIDLFSGTPDVLGTSSATPTQQPSPIPTPVGIGDTNGIPGYSRGSVNPEYVKYINDAIASLGTGTSLTPALLASNLFTESGFNPDAYNNGDRGIGQFSTKWRPDITDEVAYDPKRAIPEVAKTLNDYIGKTGDYKQGMAAYNVGLGRVGLADGRNEYGLGPKGMEYIKKIAKNLSKIEAQKLGLDIFQ